MAERVWQIGGKGVTEMEGEDVAQTEKEGVAETSEGEEVCERGGEV